MKLKQYIVNAFTNELFGGNPAAVVPLDKEWLEEGLMQKIAAQNNLSETSFFVEGKDSFQIRWFTPKTEVKLCGHATLATAYVLKEILGFQLSPLVFQSKSGILKTYFEEDIIYLDFPKAQLSKFKEKLPFKDLLGKEPIEVLLAEDDLLCVFKNDMEIASLQPNYIELSKLAEYRGIICTAKSKKVDFVSRFFAPAVGVNEDPVTGSAHTKLLPYWSEKLQRHTLSALQISERRGKLTCHLKGDRAHIGGNAKLFSEGTIYTS